MHMSPTSAQEDPPAPALGSSHSDHRFQGFPSDHRIPSFSGGGSGGVMAKYKMMSPARLPITRSPCTTITITSPGFSPGALLESPVLLTNVKAESSPTTGTFSIPSVFHCSIGSDTSSSPKESSNSSTNDEGTSGVFEFKPYPKSCLGTAQPRENLHFVDSKELQTERSVQCWSQNQHQPFASSYYTQPEDNGTTSHELTLFGSTKQAIKAAPSTEAAPQEVASNEMDQEKGQEKDCQTLEIDPKGSDPSSVEKTSEDGYNWRKYGQKHVKGSEFPRSYYKCTHPNCQMKKQLERSHDGQIADIIYKGSHDHPKPQPTRRSAAGTVFYSQEEEKVDGFSSLVSMEEDGQISHLADLDGPKEFASATTNGDDVEVASAQLNNGSETADDDDAESKRRRMDNNVFDMNPMANKINREPRVVVQTLSEVDILDDGYRWRKYGQKVVKGNPNPRSYYKCTNVGCPVRKHVERASHDPKAVITTYEGKHNHDVPAAKTSSHDTALLMPLNDSSSRGSQIPGTFTGIPSTFDNTRSFQHQYNRQEESDTISLDLGVGLSPRQKEIVNNTHQVSRPEQQILNPQGHITSSVYGHSVLQVSPIPPYYGGPNNAMVYMGPRDDTGDGFSFKSAPLNNSFNPYHSNIGSLLMGP